MTDFTETRSMLKKLAMAHGAETAVGRASLKKAEADFKSLCMEFLA